MTQYTGTMLNDLLATVYRVQQDNQHDEAHKRNLEAAILANQDKSPKLPIIGITEPLDYGVSKYCIWPIWMNSTGTDAVECGKLAVGDSELCDKHLAENGL